MVCAVSRPVLLALVLLAVAAPTAGARTIDVPQRFATQLERAHAQTTVPILLPQTMRSDFRRFFAEGRATADAWRFDLAAARDCNQANVCFVAEFKGVRDGRPSGRRTIRLDRGRTGYYHRGTCRAYCTPPSIEWRERHARYSIQAKVPKRELIRMANSAIRNGPR
jgi:hypothetical protein